MNTNPPTFAGGTRATLGALLQKVLAHESQLAARTRDCSWRVRGSPRQSIKRLFAEQGRQIERWVDEIGTRSRAIGMAALKPAPPREDASGPAEAAPRAAVAELLARHEALMAELRWAVAVANERDADGDTSLLLGSLLEFHETSAWMLRLLLESPERARVV